MRVRYIEVENYRGFERLQLELPDEGPTVLIGENGAGKSSLLRLLAVALANVTAPMSREGPALSRRDIRREAESVAARVELSDGRTWRLPPFDGRGPSRGIVNAGPGPSRPVGSVFTYLPAYRTVADEPARTARREAPFARASFAPFLDWYRRTEDVENEIRLRSDAEHRDPLLESVRRALVTFVARLPGARYANPRFSRVGEWAAGGRGTFLLDKDGVTLALDQLSDGEAMMLLLAGDLARRLGEAASNGTGDPLSGPGVVLIDEIEQHLHPQWQRAILPALGAAFPRLQFIVTTHSPVVLGTIPRENVVWLHDFRRVEAMPRTYGRDGTSILSDVMGLAPHLEELERLVGEIARAIDWEDFARARQLLRELEEILGPDDPEVIRQRTALHFLEGEP